MLDHYFYANLFKALFSEVEMDGFLRKSKQHKFLVKKINNIKNNNCFLTL